MNSLRQGSAFLPARIEFPLSGRTGSRLREPTYPDAPNYEFSKSASGRQTALTCGRPRGRRRRANQRPRGGVLLRARATYYRSRRACQSSRRDFSSRPRVSTRTPDRPEACLQAVCLAMGPGLDPSHPVRDHPVSVGARELLNSTQEQLPPSRGANNTHALSRVKPGARIFDGRPSSTGTPVLAKGWS